MKHSDSDQSTTGATSATTAAPAPQTPPRTARLVAVLCLVQLAFLVVFGNHFHFERGLVGGNEALYSFLLDDRLAVFDLPEDYYSAQFQNAAYDDFVDYAIGIAGAETREPFRFRVVYIWTVKALTLALSPCDSLLSACGLDQIALAAKIVNWAAILGTFFVLLAAAPAQARQAPHVLALAAAGAFNFGTVITAPFVMADITAALIFAAAGLCFLRRRFWALVAVVCIGILVKEIAVILGLLIAAAWLRRDGPPLWAVLAGGALPLAVFVGIRVAMGSDPLSLNYGWDVTEGEFEIRYFFMHAEHFFQPYLIRMLSGVGVAGVLFLITLRYRARIAPELWAFLAVWGALMVANILLASMVVRVSAPLAPLLATALLHFGVQLSAAPARRGQTSPP